VDIKDKYEKVMGIMVDDVSYHLELSHREILKQLTEISARQFPEPGRRQVAFNVIETLLCYGLFALLDPHRYGGANIDKVPPIVQTLAAFFRRTPGSITNKMLNLDGSRVHSARHEPLLFALLASEPAMYQTLYRDILNTARDLSIGEESLPDFLDNLHDSSISEELFGQDDLPNGTNVLLAGTDNEMKAIEQVFALGDSLTEKLVERKIRLSQHRFALEVLENCGRACVFCGFEPRSLPVRSGLLRASHIKPWAVADHRERMDVRNGLAACPMHDAAFDQCYLAIKEDYHIYEARLLKESVVQDRGVNLYFGDTLSSSLILPLRAKRPADHYLVYHWQKIFKGLE
jgi:putative restriction endonuclease